jgi:hypothetical protein
MTSFSTQLDLSVISNVDLMRFSCGLLQLERSLLNGNALRAFTPSRRRNVSQTTERRTPSMVYLMPVGATNVSGDCGQDDLSVPGVPESRRTARMCEKGTMTKLPYEQVFDRIRAEFLEMPGMRLTPAQVERLAGVDRSICQSVLDDLVRAGFLCTAENGRYCRLSEAIGVAPRTREPWVRATQVPAIQPAS